MSPKRLCVRSQPISLFSLEARHFAYIIKQTNKAPTSNALQMSKYGLCLLISITTHFDLKQNTSYFDAVKSQTLLLQIGQDLEGNNMLYK